MDCRTATTFDQLYHDNVTSLPEICGALYRAGLQPVGVLVGQLYDDAAPTTSFPNGVGPPCSVPCATPA